MRVLFLNPIGQIGGAERVLLTALAGLKREVPRATLRVVQLAEGPLAGAVAEAGGEAEILPLPASWAAWGDSEGLTGPRSWLRLTRAVVRAPRLATFLARLRRTVTAFRPDLVHSNGIKTHLLSRFAVPARLPVLWHAHDLYGQRRWAGWLLRRARSRAAGVVAVSRAVAEDVRRVLPGVRVAVVPNAVDTARFCPGPADGTDLDRRAGLPPAPPGTVRVGLIATYARWKGHLVVLDAAARLAAEAPSLPVRWYLIGGPIYQTGAQFTEAELRGAIRARGLETHVGLVPFTPDPVPVYRGLDVVVHASTRPEPFGLTVAEAMACGRAVVVSAAGGVTELFVEEVEALAVPPGDAAALARVVRRLVEDSRLRSRLGEAARGAAVARLDASGYGRRLLAAYRRLLPASRLPTGGHGPATVRPVS